MSYWHAEIALLRMCHEFQLGLVDARISEMEIGHGVNDRSRL